MLPRRYSASASAGSTGIHAATQTAGLEKATAATRGEWAWPKTWPPSGRAARADDGRPMEEIQDSGALHGAPGCRPGRGGQVLSRQIKRVSNRS